MVRIATVRDGASNFVAVERDGALYRWNDVFPGHRVASALDLLQQEGLSHLRSAYEGARPLDGHHELGAPFPRPPRDLICLGKNFTAHATEFATAMGEAEEIPTAPIVFAKATTSVCGPRDVVVVDPDVTQAVDYEVELAVVIGRRGRYIPADRAYEHVAGYTVLNDLTARDLQQRHGQWFLGKSLDTFGPMGPVFVTADEIPDPSALTLSSWVDGELRQQALASQMIFDIPAVLTIVSRIMTLELGDIIAMGTPAGVGIGFDPPRYLRDGMIVVAEIDGIGRLENRISFRRG
ncbi:MAG: fumarylacetoacetate hydrolase family protein [Candidatus Limnocylindria bacterium]